MSDDMIKLEVSYATKAGPMFGVNACLVETMKHDKGLSDDAKDFFKNLVASGNYNQHVCNCVAELVRKNYIWIEGFPTPPVAADRRSQLTKIKEFFQRRQS